MAINQNTICAAEGSELEVWADGYWPPEHASKRCVTAIRAIGMIPQNLAACVVLYQAWFVHGCVKTFIEGRFEHPGDIQEYIERRESDIFGVVCHENLCGALIPMEPIPHTATKDGLILFPTDPDGRFCNRCKRYLPTGRFKRQSLQRSQDGLRYLCSDCEKTAASAYTSSGDMRAIRMRYIEGAHSEAEWAILLINCGNQCLRCGVRGEDTRQGQLTKDHIRPVSRGGTNDIGNLQPLCQSCNSWKFDREIDFRGQRQID
jgi:5-methylcytosine-specific restriction endonuclease McrA